jgi:hypothetical protein
VPVAEVARPVRPPATRPLVAFALVWILVAAIGVWLAV